MFGLSTSQWYGNGEVGVEENPQVIVYRIMSITISNCQDLWLGFSLRSTPQHMWVMGLYIVWARIECIKNDNLANQNISWVSRRRVIPVRHSQKPTVSILS